MERKRVLTGDRPTGKLHLGHYLGSLRNRVKLQEEYDCYFVIADLHMLTTQPGRDHIAQVAQNVRDIVLDYLAAGINPARSSIFIQSAVPETAEKEQYRQGRVGDVEVKRRLERAINSFLEPLRQRRREYETEPDLVKDLLIEGTRRMRALAQETMALVYEAMGLYGLRLMRTGSLPLPEISNL